MMRHGRYYFLIITIVLVYFGPNLRLGTVLLPLDILHHLSPFSVSIPEALERIHNPHLSDLITVIHPWMEIFRSAEAIVPLWNPYSFCGSPLLANGQTGLLFPLTWIYRLLPLEAASLCVAAGKLAFCGIFAFLYYRQHRFADLACLFGSVAYMFSGQVITWLGYPGVFPLVTTPFLFWAIEKYLLAGRSADLIWISAGYGLLFLGSQPQFGVVIAAASALYFVIRAQSGNNAKIRTYLAFVAAAAFGFCLAAPQILPFLEYLRESAAFRHRGAFGWKHYPWYTIISWMVPRFFGDLRDDNFWGFSSLLGEATYIGTIPLLFATVGLISARKHNYYWGTLGVFGVGFFGLYVPITQWLYKRVPLLSSIDNNKLVILIILGLASFAVAGFNRMLDEGTSRQRIYRLWHWGAGLWVCFIALGVFYFRSAIREMNLQWFEARELLFHLTLIVLGSSVLTLWKNEKLRSSQAGALLLILSTGDVFRIWMYYYPSYPARYSRPYSKSVEFLRTHSLDTRIFGLNGSLPPEVAALYRLQDVRGIDGLTPYRYYAVLETIDPGVHDLLVRLQTGAPKGTSWTPATLFYQSIDKHINSSDPEVLAALRRLDYWSNDISRIERPGLLSLLGVRYVICSQGNMFPGSAGFRRVHSSDAEVWENHNFLPRAFVSTRPIFAESDEEALQLISDPGFLVNRRAVIRAGKLYADNTNLGAIPDLVPARIDRSSLHSVELTAESPEGGWLILSDLFYPGWKASVDGESVPVFPGNYLFRAVKFPPGRHKITFLYRPTSFYVGVCLSSIALLVLGLVYIMSPRLGAK